MITMILGSSSFAGVCSSFAVAASASRFSAFSGVAGGARDGLRKGQIALIRDTYTISFYQNPGCLSRCLTLFMRFPKKLRVFHKQNSAFLSVLDNDEKNSSKKHLLFIDFQENPFVEWIFFAKKRK